MTHSKRVSHIPTKGKTPMSLLVAKNNTRTPTTKSITPELSLPQEAELVDVIQEAEQLISTPASSVDTSPDQVKLKGAKDFLKGILKCGLQEALQNKQYFKELKEAFLYLCSIGFFDKLMALRLERMLNDVEAELPHLKEAIGECSIGREQEKDLQRSLKALKSKMQFACVIKAKIVELGNELLDLKKKSEVLQHADRWILKDDLEVKMGAELDQLLPEKEALERQCKLVAAFREKFPDMKNRINAGIGSWEAFKAALKIQFSGVN